MAMRRTINVTVTEDMVRLAADIMGIPVGEEISPALFERVVVITGRMLVEDGDVRQALSRAVYEAYDPEEKPVALDYRRINAFCEWVKRHVARINDYAPFSHVDVDVIGYTEGRIEIAISHGADAFEDIFTRHYVDVDILNNPTIAFETVYKSMF